MKIAFVGDSFCAHHGPGTPVGEDFELGLELGKKYGLDIDQYNVCLLYTSDAADD